MKIGKAAWMLSLTLALVGCATPQIHLNSGDMVMEVNNKVPPVGPVAYSPDGKNVASGGWDDVVRLWDLTSARKIREFKDDKGADYAVAFSPDGKTIAASSFSMANLIGNGNGTTTLWDVGSGTPIQTIKGCGGSVLSFSPDGRFMAGHAGAYGVNGCSLYDPKAGAKVRELKRRGGIISPDGKCLLEDDGEAFVLSELASGRTLWRSAVGYSIFNRAAFTPDGKYILTATNNQETGLSSLKTSLHLLDAATGYQIKEINRSTNSAGFLGFNSLFKKIVALVISPDGKLAITGDGGSRYKVWDIAAGTLVTELKTVTGEQTDMGSGGPDVDFAPDGKTAVVSSSGAARIFDVSTGNELATMIAFENGEWLVITPNGYYNSSEKGDQNLSVKVGGKPYTIAQLRESFYRPDLVKVALSGGSLQSYRKIADIKQPPSVSIINTPSSVSKDEVSVTLRIVDSGGGIGDVRLYNNGSAVLLDSSRGVKITPTGGEGAITRSYAVKLVNGVNALRAIVFNGDNTMQSADALFQVTANLAVAAKPSLHAIVIGINEYKNPRLQLNYAAADAKLFADTLKRGASGMFDKVDVKFLSTRDETTSQNILNELNAMRRLKPDDLFVFYVASHGTVDEGEYFLITSNVGSTRTERLKTDALSQSILKEAFANIPATKKLIIIDTCNAGALGEAIQTAMLTRGMSEDTAMKILSRAVGSTILSASTDVQEALEGYHGHGLFTFVLSEGLSGKADKGKTGFVRTTELADYVDVEVPTLAEKVFKRAQYPTISMSGQAFPIGKAH